MLLAACCFSKDNLALIRNNLLQERKAGVDGASKNLEHLQEVDAKKSEYDRRKGMTLQEHSEVCIKC